MKLTTLILLVTFLQVSARSFSQDKLSLDYKNTNLEKIFKAIGKKSDYTFLYKNNMIPDKKVDIKVTDMAVKDIMDQLLFGTSLSYNILANKLIVITGKNETVADTTINGKIVSKSGDPLVGVTVHVKGTQLGTITNENGAFSLTVPDDAVLEVSYIGYKTQEITVGNKQNFNIQLESSAASLNEVVVVGYGTQKKVDLTGSIAQVSGEKLESRPITNLGDGLNGLIPNLNVNIQNGQPGTAATFNIRGFTTIGSNSSPAPLVLVDGVQRDPNLIDPNDVASVTVLKDAASAAIYGGRAAYGVILITTKKGKAGKPQLSYSGSYTLSRPTNLPDYVNSMDYIALFNEAQRTGSQTGGYTSSDPLTQEDSLMAAAYFNDPANNPDAYPDPGNPKKYRYVGNTDWVKVLYPGWAPLQQHNVTLSGGDEKTTYVASMGYLRQEGLEKVAHQIYDRYTPNLNVNSEVTKWMTVNLNMSMTHTDNNGGASSRIGQGGPTNGSWIPGDLRPLQPVYNPDGHFSGQGNYTNPVAVLTNSGRDIDHLNDYWVTGRVVLTPVKHINITSDYTWNSLTDFDRANLIPFNEYGVDGVFLDIFPWTNPSQITENRKNYNYNAFNAYASYENTFNTKHYFKALLGYNQEYKHYQTDYSFANNLIVPDLVSIGQNNDVKPVVDGTETEYALTGVFFRLNYNYDQKYLLEINGRYDGTSRFQANNRTAFSPSVSAGWNIAEEPFMQGLKKAVNELKLRLSYGQLPNQSTKDEPNAAYQYPYIATLPYGQVGYLFNNQLGEAVYAPDLVSPTYTWEKVQTKNIGLDYAFLNGRLSGSFDYFITDTKDMLVTSKQLPAVLGTNPPTINSANLRTKGWEFSANWADKMLNDKLNYNITLGLADNYSYITKYGNNPTFNLGDYYPGERLGQIWGYTTEGFYQTDAEAAAVDNSALAGYTWLAGDVKYKDFNKDGKIDYGDNTLTNPGDMRIIGNSTPRYHFNVNLNLEYSGFDFTAFIQGVLKRDYVPGGNVFYGFAYDEWGIPYKYATDRWTPTHTDAYFARSRFNGSGNRQTQTKYLQNAAYGRVKQLTLGYSLPQAWLNRITVQKVRIYITGENLFTITSLVKAYDPELLNFQSYPINKSVSFGLQATL